MVSSVSPKHKSRGHKEPSEDEYVYHTRGEQGVRDMLVLVHINLSKHKLGQDWENPCTLEKLGIIPNRLGSVVTDSNSFNSLSLKVLKRGGSRLMNKIPVIVRGVVPASPAMVNGHIDAGKECVYEIMGCHYSTCTYYMCLIILCVGDHLVAVEGQEVTLANVDDVLAEQTGEVT